MSTPPQSFSQSPLLKAHPELEDCQYKGSTAEAFQKYCCRNASGEFMLLTAQIIRKDEDFIWKACDELLARTIQDAAQSVQGFYGFQVVSLELGEAIRNFQWENLRNLIINHARTLQVGEERLIQYTSLFGILKKRIPESWGKIEYLSPVKVLSQPSGLGNLIKKLLKAGVGLEAKFEIMIHDLGNEPVFRFGEEPQTPELEKILTKFLSKQPLPPLYVSDVRGMIELGLQFGLRES